MRVPPRRSVAWLMAIVAILAVDFAALSLTRPAIPNPGLALMVAILELGLFLTVARRGPALAFWVGFEAFGWAYVLACFAMNRAAWALARSLFEGYFLGAKISRPGEMGRYILFASGLQLVLSMAVALVGGLVLRRIATVQSIGKLEGGHALVPLSNEMEPSHEGLESAKPDF
jgi:hypothetical protein